MKTAVPPPALQLSTNIYEMEQSRSTPLGRTLSVSSTSSNGPLTPLGQTINTPTPFLLQRLNSVSSIGTSDDEEAGRINPNNPLHSFTEWPSNDDELLMSVYQAHLDNPSAAPFAGRVPPSGVVHRVAKDTAKRAKQEGRPFPHSLNAIRKRLLLLCGRQVNLGSRENSAEWFLFDDLEPPSGPGGGIGSGNSSPSGTPVWSQSFFSTSLGISLQEDNDNSQPLPSVPNIHYFGGHTPPRMGSPSERMRNNSVNNWLHNTPAQDTSINGPTANFPGYPSPASPLQRTTSNGHPIFAEQGQLSSPFKESFGSPKLSSPASFVTIKRVGSPAIAPDEEKEDPFPNYTAQRKRESLRMKRGMQQ